MSRPLHCLIAWEMGANFGHLARCLAVAKALRAAGHQVLFAVRDTRVAAELLTPQRFSFVQAPVSPSAGRTTRPPVSYADMLLQDPYRDALTMRGNVQSWLSLFRLFQPNVLIADHAPTALLAARVAELPAVAIGDGFDLPPNVSPMPSMRPWEDVAAEKLQKAEGDAVRRINTVLQAHGKSSVPTVSALFSGAFQILATFPELDPYGARPQACYAGVFYSLDSGQSLTWPTGDGAKIFVYLRPEFRGVDAVLSYLRNASHHVIFVAPGMHDANVKRFSTSRLQITNTPIALAQVLPQTDLVIGYGSIGLTAQALRSGLPQLIIPPFVAHALYARRVVEMGAGRTIDAKPDVSVCAQAVEALLNEKCYRQAAQAFAKKYTSYDAGAQISEIVQKIEGYSIAGESQITRPNVAGVS